MNFDDFMPRFVTPDQFDTTARTIKSLGQQSSQCLVGGRLHGRRGDPDSQFVAVALVRQDFIGRRTRLEFHGKQNAVRLGAKETRKFCPMNRIVGFSDWWIAGQSTFYLSSNPLIRQSILLVFRIDEPKGQGRHCAAGEIGNQVYPEVGNFLDVHHCDTGCDGRVEGAPGNTAK